METSLRRRSELYGIPIDSFDDSALEACLESFLDGKNHQIVLLRLGDLVRARRPGPFRTMIQGADLVLPVSPSILSAALGHGITDLRVHEPFSFVIKLLSALENRNRSVFLVGGSRKLLARAERNLAATFPGLRIVGRQSGRYNRAENAPLMEAIRKATPSLILAGSGIPGNEAWIPQTMPRINSGIFLWCPEIFTTLATGRRKRRPVAISGKRTGAGGFSLLTRILGSAASNILRNTKI